MPFTQRSGKGRWLRLVWVTAWFSIGLGGLVLLPALLPIYGARLPSWVWWSLPAEFGATVVIAFRSARRRDGFGNQWGMSAATSLGCSIIYAVGAWLLLTRSFDFWEYVGIGAAGVSFLALLVWADEWSRRIDEREYRKDGHAT